MLRVVTHHSCRSGGASAKKAERVSVVPLSRANNVSIMLTQFSQFKQGSDTAQGIRRAVVTGKGLSLERLSLLLQVRSLAPLSLSQLLAAAAALLFCFAGVVCAGVSPGIQPVPIELCP